MQSLRAKLAAFQRSRPGLFLKKFSDDKATNLGQLLAWGTLSTLLPLLLGVLSLAGIVLRDSQRVDQVYSTLVAVVPQSAAGPLTTALESIRQKAGAGVGIVGLLLLLFNGSGFFANMASVFDQVFHVQDRNFIMQRVVSIVMLVIATVLIVVSTIAVGLGSAVDAVPFMLPVGPVLGKAISWSISIVSVVLLFWLMYRLLPNKPQTWGQALPGALSATVLVFIISQVFPLYVALFPPNQAYAAFGIFLVLTFFLYMLGLIFVVGAELNAFLQEPARSVALAEATEQAAHGKAAYSEQSGEVQAETTGEAPRGLGGPLHPREVGGGAKGGSQGQGQGQLQQPGRASQQAAPGKPGIGGRLVGLVGLVLAAFLLRGRTVPEGQQQPSRA
jgi:membrane protein